MRRAALLKGKQINISDMVKRGGTPYGYANIRRISHLRK